MKENATFYSFKPSGKWYATGRGHLPEGAFRVWTSQDRRGGILAANGGKYPGLSSTGDEFDWVVLGDDSLDYAYPLLLLHESHS